MRLRTVVIGIDFSDVSLRAARWVASRFAPNAELVLVHVMPGQALPSFVAPRIPASRDIALTGASALGNCLRGVADSLGRGRTRVELLSGTPHEGLAFVADEVGADLVCIGRGTARHGSARFGAATAVRLLTWTRVPTLVVPGPMTDAPSRILAGIDERTGGSIVLDAAADLTRIHAARLTAMHVIEPALASFTNAVTRFAARTGPAEWTTRRAAHLPWGSDCVSLEGHAREWIEGQLSNANVDRRCASSVVRGGDPGQEMIRHARLGKNDLIVLGRGGDRSHAAVPPAALKVGSTTRLVLWATACPVLVVAVDAAQTPPHDPPQHTRMRSRPLALHATASSRNSRVEPPLPAAHRTGRECA